MGRRSFDKMTRILGVGAATVALVFGLGSMTACSKSDDKKKSDKSMAPPKDDGSKTGGKPDDSKKGAGKNDQKSPPDPKAVDNDKTADDDMDDDAVKTPGSKLGNPDDIPRTIRAATNDTCACKDLACLAAIKKRMKLWLRGLMRSNPDIVKDLETKYKAEIDRGQACADKLHDKLGGAKSGSVESKTMSGFADKMCACKNRACSDGVHKAFIAWMTAHFKRDRRRGSKANVVKWQQAQKKYLTCRSASFKNK